MMNAEGKDGPVRFVMGNSESSQFIKALLDAGVIPPNCRRFIIDAPASGAIVLHYEVFADGDKLDSPGVLDAVREIGVKIVESRNAAVPAFPIGQFYDGSLILSVVSEPTNPSTYTLRMEHGRSETLSVEQYTDFLKSLGWPHSGAGARTPR